MLGSFFVVQGEVIKSKGDSFFIAMHNFIIPQFRGARRIVVRPPRAVHPHAPFCCVHLIAFVIE
jgi:hypothetical protein